ncbi:MAG: CDP-diacylglycerol pyrophosphatase, partial [Thermodesulfobacteriota bacterium]|nr:CDP-diacylglycerol pyrophosphatase [Thermodesulfobacteriota bacterium]
CDKWSYHHCCYNKTAAKCKVQKVGNVPVVIVEETDCHFLLVPTDPVTGVEDTKRDAHPYWNWAWLAAAGPYNPIKHKILDQSIGLAINPKTHRGQDQLHIHIGSLRNFLRDSLSSHVPHDGNWHQLPAREVYGKTCSAKFVNSNPFPSPFKEVSKHEPNMEHVGIILGGHVEAGILKGYYIVSCYDTFVEDWLYYNCPGQ